MARDLEKRFQEVERLYRQGRSAAASRELRVISEDVRKDPLILNRVGDLLARIGQKEEAIRLYDRIAEELFRNGFYPRAIAVLKKTLRLQPGHLPAVLLLGDAYARHNLPGEGRRHLLASAERFLRGRETPKARQAYEKLVALEPKEPLHRIRLAESKAVLGDAAGACDDLLHAADELARAGKASDAERTYRRAAELGPQRPETISGIARALALQDRAEEAIRFLEEMARKPGVEASLSEELFVLQEQVGRTEETLRFLGEERSDALTDSAIERVLRLHADGGGAAQAWNRLDVLLDRWQGRGQVDRLQVLLGRLAQIEGQDVPALERLYRAQRAAGEIEGRVRTLERLVRGYWVRSMQPQASAAIDELKRIAPRSPLIAESIARQQGPRAAAASDPAPARAPVPRPGAAPAPPMTVPETNADKEFAITRLTQAEVFQKYSLLDQALQEIREVVARFPGHVVAAERLVDVLRGRKDREGLRLALVDLALARGAAGDAAGAGDAARLALDLGPLPQAALASLERAGLRVSSSQPAVQASVSEAGEVEIVFDGTQAQSEVGPSAADRISSGNPPPGDAVEEIVFFLTQGMHWDAMERIGTLRRAGYASEELDDLERRASAPPSGSALDDEDLSGISDTLDVPEGELAEVQAESGSEQSVEEVFRAFKEQIASEVDHSDARTHYELGIAYKEMGLLDDAVGEFETASRSPEFFRDACSMLGLCHRERGELHEAARWYRSALEAPGEETSSLKGLRYDLAEVLLGCGDVRGALEMFGQVREADPSYRDVEARILRLKTGDHS